jgi:putative flavoprotein involved in K+ transport
VDSLLGKLMFSNLETRGDPIRRPTPKELARRWGVRLHDRFTGVRNNAVAFADGDTIPLEGLTIVWCTGLRGDYSFVKVRDRAASFDVVGNPLHRRGVASGAPGLFFMGLRYQHTVASHDIYGVPTDARFIAERIADRLVGPNI